MKTFAQKLKEHSDFIKQETDKIQSLRNQAKTALNNDESEKVDEFLAEAEQCLDTTENVMQEFEINHKEELKKLKFVAENK